MDGAKKEIKIDPELFGISGGGFKSKRKNKPKNTTKKTKEMLVNVNGKSVKELLLQKLKDYKKNKTQKTHVPVHESPHKPQRVNQDFIDRIRRKKQKTENNIHTPPSEVTANTMFASPNMNKNETTTFQYHTNNTHNENNMIKVANGHTTNDNVINLNDVTTHVANNPNAYVTHNRPSPPPLYGNLKNGNLPTYREHKMKTFQNPNTPQPGFDNTSTNNVDAMNHNHMRQYNVQPKREHVELQIEKRLRVGRNKTRKKVGVFVKSGQLRRIIENAKVKLKRENIRTVKNYLRKCNLIKHGSHAPNELMRTMYENSQLLGHVDNKNNQTLVHNFINDADENED
jgi:hypothetical protein